MGIRPAEVAASAGHLSRQAVNGQACQVVPTASYTVLEHPPLIAMLLQNGGDDLRELAEEGGYNEV
jgi:hypothetical protein